VPASVSPFRFFFRSGSCRARDAKLTRLGRCGFASLSIEASTARYYHGTTASSVVHMPGVAVATDAENGARPVPFSGPVPLEKLTSVQGTGKTSFVTNNFFLNEPALDAQRSSFCPEIQRGRSPG
jgi:hypothetical protein